jgi:O-methyltransferase involved in polyketide biosynthesis
MPEENGMSETVRDLSGVAETLLIPLYVRAVESQRPDALLKDENAVALLEAWKDSFARIEALKLDEGDRVALVLRNRELDRRARTFMARHRKAVVVHIGCGLDARFERVDDGEIEWFDLDLPEVLAMRKEFVGGEGPRHHLLASSVFDKGWLDIVAAHRPLPMLFLAEGVLMYFEEAQIRSLVRSLLECFPGAELVFDAFSPFLVRMNNRRMRGTEISARYHWGLKRAKNIETWGPGISLLEEWFLFRRPEPRLGHYRWVRYVPLLAKAIGIFHYRLGQEPA